MTTHCPHCASLLESRDRGSSRVIGVEIQGAYDGTLFWQCPDCGGRWHRFPKGHALRKKAEPYLNVRGKPRRSA